MAEFCSWDLQYASILEFIKSGGLSVMHYGIYVSNFTKENVIFFHCFIVVVLSFYPDGRIKS